MIFENKFIISDINNAFTVISNTGKKSVMVNRKFYGLSFCNKGKITYTCNGKNYVSDENAAIFLPFGGTYTLYNHTDGEFPLINFSCEKNFINDFLVIPINYQNDYIKDYERIKKYLYMQNGKLKAISILYDIIYKLLNEKNYNYILALALKYISENYGNANLHNTQIAENANISECYLRKLFLKEFSVTPKQYIINLRISNAKSALCETTLNINSISEKCGFSSVYHFCRAFKEYTGLTPTEYRKRHMQYII